jgi:hypothetical protein
MLLEAILKFTLFISALVISHLANYKMILDIAIASLCTPKIMCTIGNKITYQMPIQMISGLVD